MVNQAQLLESVAPEHLRLAVSIYVGILAAGLIVDLLLLCGARLWNVRWSDKVARLQMQPWTWLELGFLVAVLLLVMILSWLFFQPTMRLLAVPAARHEIVWLLWQSAAFHGLGLGLVLLLMRRRWNGAGGDQARRPRALSAGALSYFAAMPVFAFSIAATFVLFVVLGYPISAQDIVRQMSQVRNPWINLYLAFFAIVIAPCFEETVFRGMFLPLLARRLGLGPAVLLSALTFAAIHGHLSSLLPLTVLAIGLALAYLYAGSLLAPIVMHGLFNGVNLLLLQLLTT
jgi:hypothetical protein